jgi:hypothetical protein
MALELFYSYAHEDEPMRRKLEKHLSLLKRSGLIVSWHDRRIDPGDEWRQQIDAHMQSAHIILFLVSSDFLSSDYCFDVEMRVALERHSRREAVVIPILLRSFDWSHAPFAHLQVLPRNARPVALWPNRDEAFAEIARDIREIVKSFLLEHSKDSSPEMRLHSNRTEQLKAVEAKLIRGQIQELIKRAEAYVPALRVQNSQTTEMSTEVDLPTEEKSPPALTAVRSSGNKPRLKILVVDDEQIIGDQLAKILRIAIDADAIPVYSGIQAVEERVRLDCAPVKRDV